MAPGPAPSLGRGTQTRDTLSTPTPTLLPLLPQPLRAQPAPSLASVLPLLQVLQLFLPPLPLLPLPSPLPPPHTSLGLALVAGEQVCAPETTAELSALAGAGEGMQGAPVERQHPRQGRQRAHHVQSCLG